MKPRAVGGWEPDDRDQIELSHLWHLSRTALSIELANVYDERVCRDRRREWAVDEFLKAHAGEPGVARKWVHVWAVDNLGRLTMTPAPVYCMDCARDPDPRGWSACYACRKVNGW